MRLVSWNVNGLRAVLRKGFLDWLEADAPDVVCLQETRLGEGLEQDFSALGYQSWWAHADKKGYSGVALLSRVEPKSVGQGFAEHERYRVEGRTLVADYGDFLLVNGYFPNGGRGPERLEYKLDYYADLLAWICRQRGLGRKVIVTGDLNTSHKDIDLARPKDNRKNSGFMPIECAWLDRYAAAGLVDSFRVFEPGPEHYSWWSNRGGARERNVGWRLDYFWVTEDLVPALGGAAIHKGVMGSDHCPVSVTLEL